MESDLGLLTDQLTTGLHRALRAELATDHDGIGPRHRAVLAHLEPAGSRAVELAHRCGQHKQVMGTLVDDLERFEYVRREPDPSDRRAKLVVPTDLGLRRRSQIDDTMHEIEQSLADSVGQQRYREFKQVFANIAAQLTELQ